MGSTVKVGNSSNGGNSYHKARPYALLLFAFATAFLVVMVLHKFRERQVLALVAAENDQQLVALHSLLQTEQIHHGKTKKKLLHIKERHKIEAKEMQSTISALKGERDKLHAALKAKNHEIKNLREQQLSYSGQLSQVAALTEILKQKEAELEELKNRQLVPVKVWSVSTDDPSNQHIDLTATELDAENEDDSQSREHNHWENSIDGGQNESPSNEKNSETQTFEGVNLVEKMDATDSSKSEEINEVHSIGGDDPKEINIDEVTGKDNGEFQGKGDSTIAQETTTEAEETTSRQTPALDEKQEGKAFDDPQKGETESTSDKTNSLRKTSHHKRHRRHRGKRWREYVKSRRMGKADHTKTKEIEDGQMKMSTRDTMESQNNTTGENDQEANSNITQDHAHVKETTNRNGTTTQEAASESQNEESSTERQHETDQISNIPLSIKLQETQQPDEVSNQTTAFATEQKDHAEKEAQEATIAEKEHTEVSMPNDDNKRNSTDGSKLQEVQKPDGYSAKEEHLDANNKENDIKQVTGNEKVEDTEDIDTGIQVIEAPTHASLTQPKPNENETEDRRPGREGD